MGDFIVLQRGDNDMANKWGGKKRDEAPSYTVTMLQDQLICVGALFGKADGVYGGNTEKAIKFFQWALINVKAYVKDCTRLTFAVSGLQTVTGTLTESTKIILGNWSQGGWTLTGDLVRVSASDLSNIEFGKGFKRIGGLRTGSEDLICSTAIVPLLKDMNIKAKSLKVTVKLNQVFRIHGRAVSGAVVTPVTKSQHLIGHALDCNIVDGSNWNSSSTFKAKKETSNAKELIKYLKEQGYRWGGNFSKVDTPHFDKCLDSTTFSYDAKFFLNQRQYTNNDPIPKKVVI